MILHPKSCHLRPWWVWKRLAKICCRRQARCPESAKMSPSPRPVNVISIVKGFSAEPMGHATGVISPSLMQANQRPFALLTSGNVQSTWLQTDSKLKLDVSWCQVNIFQGHLFNLWNPFLSWQPPRIEGQCGRSFPQTLKHSQSIIAIQCHEQISRRIWGPVCVCFSLMGEKKGVECPQFATHEGYYKQVPYMADVLILECVPEYQEALVQSKLGPDWTIRSCKIDPRLFGLPIARARIYLIAFKNQKVSWSSNIKLESVLGALTSQCVSTASLYLWMKLPESSLSDAQDPWRHSKVHCFIWEFKTSIVVNIHGGMGVGGKRTKTYYGMQWTTNGFLPVSLKKCIWFILLSL